MGRANVSAVARSVPGKSPLFVAQILETFLLVQTDRIINGRANLVSPQMFVQGVAIWGPDDVLMINMGVPQPGAMERIGRQHNFFQ